MQEFRAALRAAFSELGETPLLWSIGRKPDVRRRVLTHFPYALYYRVDQQLVTIVAFIHNHQDTTRRFPETP